MNKFKISGHSIQICRMEGVIADPSQFRCWTPDCVKTRMLRVAGAVGWLMKPILCPDRFHQPANAENADYPFQVVGENVQRHFGADVFECFHLEVRRSHPRLDRPEWMLD